MLRRKPLLLSIAGAAGVAVLALSLWPSAQSPAQAEAEAAPAQPPAVVEVAVAEKRQSSGTAWVPASVVSRNDARLAGEVAGRLLFVAEVGTDIAAGDPVARVDDETLRLDLRDAEAVVGRRQAEVEQAQRQVERLRALKNDKLVAASQLDEVEATLEIRRRELAQAQVARDRARHRLARSVVRAPHAGVVVERLAQVGEYLQEGQAVARFVQTAQIELSARAPAALAERLAAGQSVPVRQDGQTHEARVRAVVPAADQVSRQVELRLVLDEGRWLVGSAAEVALPQADAHMALVVPRDALVLRPDGTYVFRVRDDGTAERLTVVAGDVHEDWVEIDGDIAAGDRLVVRGAERLRDGQAVATRPTESETQALAAALPMTAG